MNELLYQELRNRHYLMIDESSHSLQTPSQKKGSPLDRYRSEILFFKHDLGCSYQDISLWLWQHRRIKRSPTSIAKRIKLWELQHEQTKNKSSI